MTKSSWFDVDDPLAILPGENAKQNSAMLEYLALGPERSISKLAKKLVRNKKMHQDVPTVRERTLKEWSRRFYWVARVETHLNNQRRFAQQAAEDRQLEFERLAWEDAMNLRKKANNMLSWPLAETSVEDGTQIIKPMKWTAADIARILEVSRKLALIATRGATAVVEVRDPMKLQPHELPEGVTEEEIDRVYEALAAQVVIALEQQAEGRKHAKATEVDDTEDYYYEPEADSPDDWSFVPSDFG